MDNRTIEQIRKNETKLIDKIKLLEQALNKIKEYIHSEEFFMLMNSNSIDDKNKSVCEDYFKAQGKLDNILDKALGESL